MVEQTWKKATLALSRYCPGGIEENHKRQHSNNKQQQQSQAQKVIMDSASKQRVSNAQVSYRP
jgi:hypothetical protein